MTSSVLLMLVVSILLSSSAQLFLKLGMSSASVQSSLHGGDAAGMILAIAGSPKIIAGLLAFGLSVIVWLMVLSRIDVSLAYPFVALGIVLTVVAGRLFLSEQVSYLRTAGLAIIVIGVVIVAMSAPQRLEARGADAAKSPAVVSPRAEDP